MVPRELQSISEDVPKEKYKLKIREDLITAAQAAQGNPSEDVAPSGVLD